MHRSISPGMVGGEGCLRSGEALASTRAFDARDAYGYATACDSFGHGFHHDRFTSGIAKPHHRDTDSRNL